jgi:hypothetical protein
VNTTAFGTAAAPNSSTPLTISTCTYQTEYNTITSVAAGATYQLNSSCGGYITVRRTTFNGVIVSQGNAPLTFTAPAAGTYFVHYNTNAACGTAALFRHHGLCEHYSVRLRGRTDHLITAHHQHL